MNAELNCITALHLFWSINTHESNMGSIQQSMHWNSTKSRSGKSIYTSQINEKHPHGIFHYLKEFFMLRSDTGVALFLHIFYVFVFVFLNLNYYYFVFANCNLDRSIGLRKGVLLFRVILNLFSIRFHLISTIILSLYNFEFRLSSFLRKPPPRLGPCLL